MGRRKSTSGEIVNANLKKLKNCPSNYHLVLVNFSTLPKFQTFISLKTCCLKSKVIHRTVATFFSERAFPGTFPLIKGILAYHALCLFPIKFHEYQVDLIKLTFPIVF